MNLKVNGATLAGGILLLASAVFFAQALAAGADNGVTLGGPTLAPIIVTGLWVAVSLGYLLGQLRTQVANTVVASAQLPAASMGAGTSGGGAPIDARSSTDVGVAAERVAQIRWRTPFVLLAALVVYALVLKYTMAGYVLSTVVFFLVSARLLSTRPLREVMVRDVSVAIGLSLAIYLAFTRLLGIALPAGVLPL